MLYGQPATEEQRQAEAVKLALQGLGSGKIAEQIGKDRMTVWRYLQAAKKKGLIKTTETGRVEVSEKAKDDQKYARLLRDDFVQKYQPVKSWVDDMRTKKDGNPIASWDSFLNAFKTVCDTLQLSPYAIIAGGTNSEKIETVKRIVQSFYLAAQEGRIKYGSQNEWRGRLAKQGKERKIPGVEGLKEYKMAVRNFAMSNGVAFPRGIGGILSGKKINFGQYADVKLSFAQLDQSVTFLKDKFGYASIEQAAFIFYYLSCARNQAGAQVKVGGFTTRSDGWVIGNVYESKTGTAWKKYLPPDNPHQKIFLDFLAKREGKPYLFADSEREAKKFGAELRVDFKQVYRAIGIPAELHNGYFYDHAVHSLRHVGAHYWLRHPRVNYNYSIVCEIGGWKSEATLKQAYGAMPEEFIIDVLTGKGLPPLTAPQAPVAI